MKRGILITIAALSMLAIGFLWGWRIREITWNTPNTEEICYGQYQLF